MVPNDKSRLNASHSHPDAAHDNSSTSRWRRNRSSANLLEQITHPAPNPSPSERKPEPKLGRTPSKMSLFNLFSKPKVEKARGHTEVGLAVPMQPQSPKPAPESRPKSSLRMNPSPPEQQAHRSRSSQMLRPMSMKPAARKQPEHWGPPPLFQAYPQSIKYATVQACVYSTEMLVRTQSQRKQYDLIRERMDSHRDLPSIDEAGPEAKKLEKTHRRLISNSVLNPPTPQLVNKIYVLVTCGYVLQYAGEGPFDRLPEKVLKLGKESAAFASDLIPGKHWVLQILQSANEDGTVAPGPKSSILSRLRIQNSSARRAANSFLLVLESAEEMDSWMTTVRKEIDSLGGMKAKNEPIAESPAPEAVERKIRESMSHRYLVQRDPNRVSKLAPIDSPLQSQYEPSPKIVASDWEGDRGEKTVSIVTDSASLQSSRRSAMRHSLEVSSVASTPVSPEQLQLEQLRDRRTSRYSYMSAATSASGPGTRSTSRNSSPAPHSPSKEGFSSAEGFSPSESLRSATSLRSFHMNPNNATASRRRSMQPLPITNEHTSLSAASTSMPQRHSIYGPTSPTIRAPEQELTSPTPVPSSTASSTTATPHPANARFSSQFSSHTPVRSSARSSSAPPTRNVISPPPRDPAPPPGRPQSTLGSLPSAAALGTRTVNRVSQGSKPFMRPFPVRPQQTDGSMVIPRRFSSLGPAPAPIPLGVVVNRSVTAPIQQVYPPQSISSTSTTVSSSTAHTNSTKATTISEYKTAASAPPRSISAPIIHSKLESGTPMPSFEFRSVPAATRISSPPISMPVLPIELRTSPLATITNTQTPPTARLVRPASVQIRPSPAPFQSSSRNGPVRISSTPSFLPGKRASTTPTLQTSPSIGLLRQQAQMQAKALGPRKSMPVLGLPPPAPPPNMPLPPPPPGVTTLRSVAV